MEDNNMKTIKPSQARTASVLTLLVSALIIAGCGGGGSSGGDTSGTAPGVDAPAAPQLSLDIQATKTFQFSWSAVEDATEYTLLENPDGQSGFTEVASIDAGETGYAHTVFLPRRVNASYMLEACNSGGCSASTSVAVSGNLAEAVGYFKASNTGATDVFGRSVALSADGSTLAVGADAEASESTTINLGQDNDDGLSNGAVYVFSREASGWAQQAYIKASATRSYAYFGISVALSADGSTLAVGTNNGNRAFVFTRDGTNWSEQALLEKPSAANNGFGRDLALSSDGDTLAVGVPRTGDPSNQGSSYGSGEVYVFARTGSDWDEQAVLEPFRYPQDEDQFGWAVALSGDGDHLAVGAPQQDNDSAGVNGTSEGFATDSGAVYTFSRQADNWQAGDYIKASNSGADDRFGYSVAMSADGRTLAVGALQEDGDADASVVSGAAYVFVRDTGWSEQSYLKAANSDAYDRFGISVSLSADGATLAVGASDERGNAIGINGAQDDNSAVSGAAYLFSRDSGVWAQQAYIKPSNTDANDSFGTAVALSSDGATLAVGAIREDSNATGVNGDQDDNSAERAGAVYLY